MPTDEEFRALQEQLAAVRTQLNQQSIAGLPADQRSAAEARLALDAERASLAAERANLGRAALQLTAAELHQKTGVPLDELTKLTSITEMHKHVADRVTGMTPDQLREYATLQENLATASMTPEQQAAKAVTDAAAAAAAAGAAGTDKAPAGAVQAGGGSGAGIVPPDKTAEITKEYAGKGADALAEYLGRIEREVPPMAVTFGGAPAAPMAAAATSSVPAVQPSGATQPAAVPAA